MGQSSHGFRWKSEGDDVRALENHARIRRAIIRQIEGLENILAENAAFASGGNDALALRLQHRAARRRAIAVAGSLLRRGLQADLLAEVAHVELDESQRAAIEELLQAWEATTTKSIGRLADSMIDIDVERARAGIARNPILAIADGEPSEFDAAWTRHQEQRAELMADRYAARNAIAKATISAVEAMREQLDIETYAALRGNVFRAVYGRWFPDRDAPRALFDEAKEALADNDEALEQVEAIRSDWASAHRASENAIIERVEQERRGGGAFTMTGGMDQWQERRAAIRAAAVNRVQTNDAARDQLREVIGDLIDIPQPTETAHKRANKSRNKSLFSVGEDASGNIDASDISERFATTVTIALDGNDLGNSISGAVVTDGGEAFALDADDFAGGAIIISSDNGEIELDLSEILGGLSEMLPGAIGDGDDHSFPDGMMAFPPSMNGSGVAPLSRKTLEAFAESEGLSASARMIASTLHEDYLESFAQHEEAYERPANHFSMFMGNNGAEQTQSTPQERDGNNRRVVLEALATDSQLMSDLHAALEGGVAQTTLEDFAAQRERSFWRTVTSGAMMFMQNGGASEANADLVAIANANIPNRSSDANEHLAAWAAGADDLLRARYLAHQDANLVGMIMQEELMEEVHETTEEDGESMSFFSSSISMNDDDMKEMQAAEDLRYAADQALNAHSRAAAAAIETSLSSDDAWRFACAYRRAAWPLVYRDRTSTKSAFAAARKIDALNAAAIAMIEAIDAEHAAAYEAISMKIISTIQERQAEPEPNFGSTMSQGSDTVKKLKFERSELNAETIRRLQKAVGPEFAETIVKKKSSRSRGQVIEFPGLPQN